MKRTVLQELSSCLQAHESCVEKGNSEWARRHNNRVFQIAAELLPSGSGFDGEVTVMTQGLCDKWSRSRPEKRLIIRFEFHHMDENGYYTHWSKYILTLEAGFQSPTYQLYRMEWPSETGDLQLMDIDEETDGIVFEDLVIQAFDAALSAPFEMTYDDLKKA